MSHKELKKKALQKPEVKEAYDALGPEFELLNRMLRARKKAKLSQSQVAMRMGTKQPVVGRLERDLITGEHSPSLETLRKYAHAMDYEIEVRLKKKKTSKPGRKVIRSTTAGGIISPLKRKTKKASKKRGFV